MCRWGCSDIFFSCLSFLSSFSLSPAQYSSDKMLQYDIYRDFIPIALRKSKIVYNFGLSECNKVKK